jgi:hypothetical protein
MPSPSISVQLRKIGALAPAWGKQIKRSAPWRLEPTGTSHALDVFAAVGDVMVGDVMVGPGLGVRSVVFPSVTQIAEITRRRTRTV